ncbi:hypothetical protein CYMTET_11451 [Cymbomonas tetramitiformis]|uniref:Uncharacterized protein n=1 Tax=Cymbomonas tetramitiformis TaxID=36881 RepID=A0AAE0LD02_9CHLO|nr:hypothetical protein CYMTET_11451 [Cymbomonas tetramitiformis]
MPDLTLKHNKDLGFSAEQPLLPRSPECGEEQSSCFFVSMAEASETLFAVSGESEPGKPKTETEPGIEAETGSMNATPWEVVALVQSELEKLMDKSGMTSREKDFCTALMDTSQLGSGLKNRDPRSYSSITQPKVRTVGTKSKPSLKN